MLSVLAFALVMSDPSATAPVAAQSTPEQTEVKEERKICKRESISTSLHGSKRVCLTAKQWKDRDLQAEYGDMGGVTTK